jgi:hypothetical protein
MIYTSLVLGSGAEAPEGISQRVADLVLEGAATRRLPKDR